MSDQRLGLSDSRVALDRLLSAVAPLLDSATVTPLPTSWDIDPHHGANGERLHAELEAARDHAERARTCDDDALLQVRALHAPVLKEGGHVCEGCDAGGYAYDDPEWPCRTANLVYTDEEIADRRAATRRSGAPT